MDALKYQAMLQRFLVPCGHLIGGVDWIFVQDNAPIHTERSTMQFLADADIRVLPWPALSPDLNPIENLWSILSQRVYFAGTQFNSIQDLKNSILKCWDEISIEIVRNLVNSMTKRCHAVIELKGLKTKY